ncbi:hypothetical protein P3T76_013508 [Phytophthora citrophthora]|uniref:Uncharacterized protein n=1 Tax=Phytophthora citrophthora TaxID=4793 RepID=A0AAD9G2Q6_9STRA|nr:hypothetical protein P3T76_013508 [Phytophthora citrophthora]
MLRLRSTRFGAPLRSFTGSTLRQSVEKFDAIAAANFKSVAHLFQALKAARDQANRNSSEALKTGLISQQLMPIKVLAGTSDSEYA